jgi:FkbM family methyltransferase
MSSVLKSKISHILQSVIINTSPKTYIKKYFAPYHNLSFKNINTDKAEYEMALLPLFLKKDSVFFDIGSNIGSFIYIAQQHINPNQVYGFEPIPVLYKRLKKIFPSTHLNRLALSNITQQTEFKIPKINHKTYLTRGTLNVTFNENNESGYELIKVNTQTLDKFIDENNIPKIDLIKIDVEGHEFELLKGAEKTLEKHKPILIIEIEQRHHNFDISIIIDYIKNFNYECFYFNKSQLELQNLNVHPSKLQDTDNSNHSKSYVQNFVFIPKTLLQEDYVTKINQKIKKQIN